MTKKIEQITNKSIACEKELICELLVSFPTSSAVIEARAILDDDDFYYYGKHFNIILDCRLNDKNLSQEFRANGLNTSDYLELSYRPIDRVCRDIKELANLRRIYKTLDAAIKDIPLENSTEFISNTHRGLLLASKGDNTQGKDITTLISQFRASQAYYKEKFLLNTGIIGLSTGYEKLDNIIDGLRPEHLWVIGGYTNMGKTFVALNIVAELIRQKKRVVFFTLEMSEMDILSRLVGVMTGQSGLTILKNYPHNEKSVEEALRLIEESGLVIKAGGMEISQIEFSAYEQNLKSPVDLFVVDFLQLITVKGAKNDYETTTTAILEIQNLAKRFHSPFIVLSQVSNESAKFNDSMVMGFKGSGAISAAADLAIEINMNEDSKEKWKNKMAAGEEVKMRWNVKKNRHGKTGYLDMLFLGRTGIFREDKIDNF